MSAATGKPKPVWMVAGEPIEPGQETPTFGPFATKEEALKFAALQPVYRVYDHARNLRSPCGPWIF